MSWRIELPYATPPLNLNQKLHWQQKRRLVTGLREYVAAMAAALPPCERVHVQLHYEPRDDRRRDADNLVATLKPCLDGLVDAGVVADDTPAFVSWSPPIIEPKGPGHAKGRLWLIVTELPLVLDP